VSPSSPNENETPQSIPKNDVTVKEVVPPFRTFLNDPRMIKEAGAKWIAICIVAVFAALLLLSIIFGFVIVIKKEPTQAKEEIDCYISLLEALGKISSVVFSPLLAFVLGHYFSSRHTSSSSNSDDT
jgi:hypothetical protein